MAGGGAPDWDDLVLVGVIARPRGIRGEVIVNPVTDFPEERFAEGAVLQARRAGSPSAARPLISKSIPVARDRAAPAPRVRARAIVLRGAPAAV